MSTTTQPRIGRMIPPRVGRDSLLSDTWPGGCPAAGLFFLILLTQVPFGLSVYYSLTDWTVVPPARASSSGSRTTAICFATTSSATRS